MATCLFRSPLAFRLQAFLQTHRGTERRGVKSNQILLYLDRFLMSELQPGQTITREIAERWLASMAHLSPGTRSNRMSVLRQFCGYLSYFDPRTCIVHRSCLPRRTRPAPHIYTRNEVRQIMTAAQQLGPPGSLRPTMIASLVGLLYATGLRIGEALNLTLGDIDLRRQVLLIREGKFHKSRYVPLASSTAQHLADYLRQRRKAGFATEAVAPLFVTSTGARYGAPSFATDFLQILRRLGLRGPKGQRGPRVHDLRHAFAVTRLLAWYRQGVNLNAKLPLLSTYLGHTTVTGTEVYLHATAQLLERAGHRFHDHFAIPPRRRVKPHAPH